MSGSVERPPSLLALPSFLTAQVARGLRAEVQRVLDERSLDTPHHGVLMALADYDALSQQELADRLDTDKSHIVRLIDQLETRQLLTRSPDPDDRRRHRIELTSTGLETAREIGGAIADVEDRYLGVLSSAERATLITLLQRVLGSAGD